MNDRKLLAAADDTEYQPPEIRVVEVQRYRCNRCGVEKAYFDKCKGCEELMKIKCSDCGRILGEHTMQYGARKRRRLWIHPLNWPKICKPTNDPIQQKPIPQTELSKPRVIWEDSN